MPIPAIIGGISAGIGAVGGLSQLFGGRAGMSPDEIMREILDMLDERFGPASLQREIGAMDRYMAGSPAFRAQRQDIALAGARAKESIARSLGQAGIRGSGAGALTTAVGTSLPSIELSRARGRRFETAAGLVAQNFGQRAQAASYGLQRVNPQVDPWAEFFASLTGAGGALMGLPGEQPGGGYPVPMLGFPYGG